MSLILQSLSTSLFSSLPLPFVVGLQVGGLTIAVLIILHRIFMSLTPSNRRLDRGPGTLPTVATVKTKPVNKETVSVVVGGSGFLGNHIVNQLLARGDKVRVVDLGKGKTPNVEYIVASILDEDKLTEAFRDAKIVFHTASILEFNSFPLAYDINVTGTRHVLNACIRAGVTRLVYTSSVAVVMDGKHVKSGDENTLTYTKSHLTPYGTTKALAEIMVLRSNGHNGLRTVALRPPGLYGPGENVFTATLMNANAPILSGSVIQDFMYIENTAHAHILAGDALTDKSPVPGQFYFIADEGKDCLELCRKLSGKFGVHPRALPKFVALILATIIEAIYLFGGGYFTHMIFKVRTFFPGKYNKKTYMNIGIVRTSHLHFHVSTAKSERDFGYKRLFSTKEAIDKTVAYMRQMTKKGDDVISAVQEKNDVIEKNAKKTDKTDKKGDSKTQAKKNDKKKKK